MNEQVLRPDITFAANLVLNVKITKSLDIICVVELTLCYHRKGANSSERFVQQKVSCSNGVYFRDHWVWLKRCRPFAVIEDWAPGELVFQQLSASLIVSTRHWLLGVWRSRPRMLVCYSSLGTTASLQRWLGQTPPKKENKSCPPPRLSILAKQHSQNHK